MREQNIKEKSLAGLHEEPKLIICPIPLAMRVIREKAFSF